MKTHSVERLTRQKVVQPSVESRDVREILDEISVKHPKHPSSVQEHIEMETEEPMTPGESAGFTAVFNKLSWIMFSAALIALGWLTVTTGKEFLTP